MYNGLIFLRKNWQMSNHLLSVQFCKYAVLCHTQIFYSGWVAFAKNFIREVVRFMAVMTVDYSTCYLSWTVCGLTATMTDVFK